MNKLFYFLVAAIVFTTGCKQAGFKKSEGGLEYQIKKGDGGPFIKQGNTIKFVSRGFYNDSLLSSPNGQDTLPQMVQIDSANLPAPYLAMFSEVRKGDSLIVRILVDSLMKKAQQMPPFAKPGKYFSTHFKILEIYTDTAAANKERADMMNRAITADSLRKNSQLVKDDQILSDYLHQNNITAVKTPKGVYVQITEPGTGSLIQTGNAVTVNYKGTNLKGRIFDQSYDSTGKAVRPFTFVAGSRQAIEGWDEAITYFRKGAKGKIYVPSALAYGSNAMSEDIKANENLIFEMQITDVADGVVYQKKQMERQRTQSEQMRRMQELQNQIQQQQPNK
ncbi:hypothetical protein BH09BAC2_BH09BAC2_20290 [soil metagenome]